MKKTVSVNSTLWVLAMCICSSALALGAPKNLVSCAYVLLTQSPPGTVLFEGSWYPGHRLPGMLSRADTKPGGQRMMATCGGIVGGTGLADDFDGDGVCNGTDIDDDNDGVADAIESPVCFYTAAEAGTIVSVKTSLANDDGTNANLPFMHDGVTTSVAASNNVISINQSVNGAVIYEIEYPTAVKLTSISHNGTTFGTSATAMIQGSNDNVGWDNLMTAATAATANPKIFTVNNNTANSYRYYRIVKIAGTTTPAITSYEVSAVKNTTGYNASAHPKPSCTDPNIDNDNMLAHMDLDTDGDGCSDALEAGATTDLTVNYQFPNADANEDGLVDAVDTDNDGFVNYSSTYSQYAMDGTTRACLDSDGDGVTDVKDLDDDNDGILDAQEMFCRSGNLTITGINADIRDNNEFSYWEASSEVVIDYPYSFQNFSALFWSVDYQDNFTVSVRLDDGTLVGPLDGRLFFNTTDPAWVSRWTTKGYPVAASDVNWTQLVTERVGAPFNSGNVFYTSPITNNLSKAWGALEFTVPQATLGNGIDKIIIDIKPGIGATAFVEIEPLNVLATCTDLDTDNDGIANRLDLDSDGDGCSDLTEASVSPTTDVITPSATNAEGSSYGIATEHLAGGQLNPAAADANNDGLNDSVDPDQNGQTNYTSSYAQYALSSNIRACDYDGDSLGDIADLDDDNDGIPDAVESPGCYFTATEANVITSITSQFTSPDDDQTDGNIQLLHDGATTLTFNFNAFAVGVNPTGSNLFTIQYPTPVTLATLTASDNISATANANAVIVGSNDGVTWSSALSSPTVITTTPVSFSITATQPYKYYRIQTGSVPGALAAANTIGEITATLAAGYVPSAHPKPTCATDTDGDGIVNHLDLDSDGDGCADATEGGGGFTTANLVESSLPGGNSGAGYTGQVSYGVDDNLGNAIDANGVPTIANGGQLVGQSQVAGTPCPENEPCTLQVGGTIVRDSDGGANGINGSAVNGVTVGLHVSLLSGGAIQEVAAVQADGTYRFTSVQPGSYQLVLGINPVGSTTSSLPSNVVSVAEGGAVDPVSGNSLGDGTVDGMTDIALTCPTTPDQLHFDFGIDSAMPVTLVSIAATQEAEGIRVKWTTADEKDFDRFEIEQSAKPQNGFSKIGTVKGGGSAYSYLDAVARMGASYYRLKMVDTDGTFAYSRIVTITSLNGKDLHRIYPNPSQGHNLYINSNVPIESYKVYDAAGREIKVELVNRGDKYELTFGKETSPGIYIIAYKAGGRVISQKFVIDKL